VRNCLVGLSARSQALIPRTRGRDSNPRDRLRKLGIPLSQGKYTLPLMEGDLPSRRIH
jgi:hypothetical protein